MAAHPYDKQLLTQKEYFLRNTANFTASEES
jgi:hypothetical protein